MAIEFGVIRQDRPGTLAQLGRLLGDARVNIEAIRGTSREGKGVHSVCGQRFGQDCPSPRHNGIDYTKREVLIVKVLDEPGMLGDVALVISEAGINIDSVYVTTRGHVVLGVDDLAGAIQVAGGMAVMAFE